MEIIQSIQNRIYEIRGERVMLDFDLAQLKDFRKILCSGLLKQNGN